MDVRNRDKTIKGLYPSGDATYLTPSDTVETPKNYRDGIYVIDGSGNTVKVTFEDDTVYTFTATELDDNDTLNASVKLVWATGTTATKIKLIKREM